jgi:hypothetical protein
MLVKTIDTIVLAARSELLGASRDLGRRHA